MPTGKLDFRLLRSDQRGTLENIQQAKRRLTLHKKLVHMLGAEERTGGDISNGRAQLNIEAYAKRAARANYLLDLGCDKEPYIHHDQS